jgi:hypothetical protein
MVLGIQGVGILMIRDIEMLRTLLRKNVELLAKRVPGFCMQKGTTYN